MADIEKLDGKSMDIVSENIAKLKEIFPDVFSEGKVDFEALEATLGEYVERDDERYSFNWNGKAKARRIAQTPSTGTLRPVKEESKDWDTTENLYIEGDNLEVLKLLQKSYHKQVKMIYVDPPYNTGKDFVYKDDFKDNIKNYMEQTGQVDAEGNKLSTNSDASGRYHSNWLNMMYPRLKLARNLLKDDGVIFISIDDNEVSNLRKICDEIFGEDNFISTMSRIMKSGGAKGRFFTPNVEFILIYAKNIAVTEFFRSKLSQEQIDRYYNKTEKDGEKKGELYGEERLYKASLDARPNQRYWIKCPDGSYVIPPGKSFPNNIIEGEKVLPTSEDGVWKWTFPRLEEELKLGNIIYKETSTSALVDENGNQAKWNIYNKVWLSTQQEKGMVPGNFINKFENRQSSAELKELKILFDFAKPTALLKYLFEIARTKEEDIILDFFSGSATTAHSIMQLNSEDNGNRKYICVQLPEETNEKSEACKAGYKNICEIGKERIRRAGEKIILDNSDKDLSNLDIGFKVFKLDSSNIKAWSPESEDLEQSLFEAVNNIKADRTEEDLLYEILLKYGLDLTLPIEELELAGKKVYVVGMGALVICLDEQITLDTVEEIAKLKEQYEADDLMRVVFRDNGFKDAEVKTNAIQILKQSGIDDVKSL